MLQGISQHQRAHVRASKYDDRGHVRLGDANTGTTRASEQIRLRALDTTATESRRQDINQHQRAHVRASKYDDRGHVRLGDANTGTTRASEQIRPRALDTTATESRKQDINQHQEAAQDINQHQEAASANAPNQTDRIGNDGEQATGLHHK